MDLKLYLLFVTVCPILVTNGKSLTFVTDTSVSMRDELVMMKRGLRSFLNDIRSVQIDKFISLPFGTSDNFESTTTWNADAFSRSINRLPASGVVEGCPENSLAAIHKALEISDDGSDVFVFTDGFAREYDIEGIKRMCQAKKSRVAIFLSGFCLPTDQLPAGNVDVYNDVTSACSGALFRMDYDYMKQAFIVIKEMLKNQWTDASSQVTSLGYITVKVPISSSTSDLVLAVSGEDVATEVTHEEGSRSAVDKIVEAYYSPGPVRTHPQLITQLLRVRNLRVGMYAVDVKARGGISLTILTKKDFPFSYGFSTRTPRGIRETSGKPMPGRDNILLIEIPNDLNIRFSQAEILTNDGKHISLSLTMASAKLYLSNGFKVNQSFKLSIHGRDLTSSEDFVETTSLIELQANSGSKPESSRPTIETLDPDSILVEAGSDVTLACKVTGYPAPQMTWADDAMVSYTPENVLLEIPSVHITYLKILKVTGNHTFYCKAENRQGSNMAGFQVFVKKDYYIEELRVPYDQNIRYGSAAELQCTFKAVPEAGVKWYHNDSSVQFSERLEVTSNNSLRIQSMGLEDVGQYACEVSNAYESKRFTAVISVDGLEAPLIKSGLPSELVWNTGSSEQLECRVARGIPTPQVTWLYRSDTDLTYGSVGSDVSSDGRNLIFKEIGQQHKGSYKCVATNVEGDDSKEFSVRIRLPPNIINDKEEYIQVKENGIIELPCAVDADPNATIQWEYRKRGGSAALDARHTVDSQHTLRFTALQKDSGDYHCTARNEVGADRRVVHVNVLVKPYIKTPASQTVEARAGGSVALACRVVHGNPAPTTHWSYVSSSDGAPELLPRGASSDLVLSSITPEQAGVYTCVATNSVGSDRVNIRLTVL